MLRKILGNYLDNGLNMRQAIVDIYELRKNKRQFSNNVKIYKKLLGEKIGLVVREFDLNFNSGIEVIFLEKNQITRFALSEVEKGRPHIINIVQTNKNDYYFANTFKNYVNDLQSNKFQLIYPQAISQVLPLCFNNNWESYGDNQKFINRVIQEMGDIIVIQ